MSEIEVLDSATNTFVSDTHKQMKNKRNSFLLRVCLFECVQNVFIHIREHTDTGYLLVIAVVIY